MVSQFLIKTATTIPQDRSLEKNITSESSWTKEKDS